MANERMTPNTGRGTGSTIEGFEKHYGDSSRTLRSFELEVPDGSIDVSHVPERIMREATALIASGKMDHLFDAPRHGQPEISRFATKSEVSVKRDELAHAA